MAENERGLLPDRSSEPAELSTAAGDAQPAVRLLAEEPEDAYLTGSSRSLQRRLLGLNVDSVKAWKPGADQPATESNPTGDAMKIETSAAPQPGKLHLSDPAERQKSR